MLRSFYRASSKLFLELFFGYGFQFRKTWIPVVFKGREARFLRLLLKLVPWTDILANIATVDPVLELWRQLFRDVAIMFDCQV